MLCHTMAGVVSILQPIIDLDAELQKGDLVWLESPLNPTGEVYDVLAYTERAHKVGATVLVDSTFAPPPLTWAIELGKCHHVLFLSQLFLALTTRFYCRRRYCAAFSYQVFCGSFRRTGRRTGGQIGESS
jgi:Cys/Met metabolism PLP-dependent enzyme